MPDQVAPTRHAEGADTRRRIWAIVGGSSGFYTSISGVVKAEFLPAEIRALGVGLGYAIANSLFGGTAEYVALWFNSQGMETTFFWYVSGFCILSLLSAVSMYDTRVHGHLAREEAGGVLS
jgi:hypothetical protein